jgi:uncharacterized membrane-anchored protein
MNSQAGSTRFLSRVLMADGVVSGLSGLALVAAPAPIAGLIGLRSAGVVAAVGVGLLVYAARLIRNARREAPRRDEVKLAVVLNLAWIVGTVVVIVSGWLNREGNWALILVGDVVLVFAVLEGIGLRKTAALTPATEGRG